MSRRPGALQPSARPRSYSKYSGSSHGMAKSQQDDGEPRVRLKIR
jgi:hypothetical protein